MAGEFGYISSDGLVVRTGTGECLRSNEFNEDNLISACEAILENAGQETEVEQVITATVVVIEPPPTVLPISTTLRAEFTIDSDTPTAEADIKINELIAKLSEIEGVHSTNLNGYTDSRGTEKYNQSLSERRASSVQDRLQT